MPIDLEIPFDRVTYRDGQLLTARDLGDNVRREARLRALHVRYLHETWGIAVGFEVRSAAGNRAVDVGPGYAVDGEGRGILLAEAMRLPVPNSSVAQPFVLAVGYLEDGAFRAAKDREGVCASDGPDPRHERPSFSWRRSEDARLGPEVPLAQVVVSAGVIQGPLDLRVRRNARPFARPYVGRGQTERGETGWRPWRTAEGVDLGLQVTVDTSEAGFRRTPHYFAMLQGDFNGLPLNPPQLFASTEPPSTDPVFFLSPFGFVAESEPERFTYRTVLGREFPFGVAIGANQLEDRGWTISWIGVEPIAGCVPTLDHSRLWTLLGELIRLRAGP